MLTEVNNNFKFFVRSIITSMKSAKEYKTSFVLQTVFMMINNATFLFSWYIIFKNTGSDEIVNYMKMLKLWVITTIGFGCAYFFFGGVENINRYLIDGDLDIYLSKPKSVLISVMTSKCRFSACGDLLFGILMGFFISSSIVEFIKMVLFGVYSMIFFVSTEIIYRSICVWVGDTENLVSKLIIGVFVTITNYPIEVFSIGIKFVVVTIIPAYYASHLPVSIVESFDIMKLIIFIVSGLLLFVFAIKLFNTALKRYESGNNITLRN